MRVTKYIKMVAESLIHDLSINWDDEKADELRQTLDDYFSMSPDGAIFNVNPTEQPKKIRKTTTEYRDRKAIVELILDTFFEGSKKGQKEYTFYTKDFDVSEDYLRNRIFGMINTMSYKKERFPDLKVTYRSIDGGVIAYIGRNK